MPFKFKTYSVAELRRCGAAFTADFSTFKSDGTGIRTGAVKDWFHEAMADGLRCYGRPFDKEFLLDQCHTTFPLPLDDEHWADRWKRALLAPCEFRFAMESEWGRYKQPKESRARVLDDAWKLAIIRATAKAVVFASHDKDDRAFIVGGLETLRKQSADKSTWLWLDIPWDFSGKRPRDTAWGLFH